MLIKTIKADSKFKEKGHLRLLIKTTAFALLLLGFVTTISIGLQFRSVRQIQDSGGWVQSKTGYLTKALPEKCVVWLEEKYGSNCLLPFEVINSVGLANTGANDSDLIALKKLPHLKSLNLISTGITDDGLIHLGNLGELEELQLDDTKVTDAGLIHLKELTELKRLYLPNQITDAGLVHLKKMTKLTELQLYDSKVTDSGLVDLEGLINLKTLFLGKTKVTTAGVQRLQAALPKCNIEY